MCSDLTKTLMLAISRTLKEVFQTLHDYCLARGLPIHTRFDDLDLASRSQVCLNHKLPIVFEFFFFFYCNLKGVRLLHRWKRSSTVSFVWLSPDTILCGWLGSKHQLTNFVWLVCVYSNIAYTFFPSTFALECESSERLLFSLYWISKQRSLTDDQWDWMQNHLWCPNDPHG